MKPKTKKWMRELGPGYGGMVGVYFAGASVGGIIGATSGALIGGYGGLAISKHILKKKRGKK